MPDASNSGCAVSTARQERAQPRPPARYRQRVTLLDPRIDVACPAPLFSFRLPRDLDGSAGTNRSALRCMPGWSDDLAALYAFLARFPGNSAGFCLYRREIERFLLWLLFDRHKPLSSADVDDCRDYLAFLSAPRGILTGPRARRFNSQWLPFGARALGETAQCHAATALRTAFEYLVNNNYLITNPWDAGYAMLRNTSPEQLYRDACLTPDAWSAILASVRTRAEEPDAVSSRTALAALLLARDAQIDLRSAAAATVGQLHYEPGHGMFLNIQRRYGRRRSVELRAETMDALELQWSDCNAPNLIARLPEAPLLRFERPAMSTRTEAQRLRAERAAAKVLYGVLENALREVYAEIESRLREQTPAVHGIIQALEALGSR